jgi:hypothetical protein
MALCDDEAAMRALRTDGFLRLPAFVGEDLVADALREINRQMGASTGRGVDQVQSTLSDGSLAAL